MSEFTQLLQAAQGGDSNAEERLLALVYDELRGLASRRIAGERPGHTLTSTALVHEAWLRLAGHSARPGAAPEWKSRSHFFAAAAESMRRILIDRARRRSAERRGGGADQIDLDIDAVASSEPEDRLLLLDEALDRLSAEHPRKADLVKLRYFAGCTIDEAATALEISTATADRYWSFARAWLQTALQADG